MIEPGKDFYAPWCTQPDEVRPMTEAQLREAARRTKEFMQKKGLLPEEQEQRTGSDR